VLGFRFGEDGRRSDHLLMNPRSQVLHNPEHVRIKSILVKLLKELRAELVLLINHSGQTIAYEGSVKEIDLVALASLAAANVAATESLARLLAENEFSIVFHQGKHRSLHISDLSKRFSLVLVLSGTVSLGLARWKVKLATVLLDEVFQDYEKSNKQESADSEEGKNGALFERRFSDDELDKLLGD
jgi:predicted regulator of Ras-like GTPase activity (Roadblock/LC7/MglB family)